MSGRGSRAAVVNLTLLCLINPLAEEVGQCLVEDLRLVDEDRVTGVLDDLELGPGDPDRPRPLL